MQPQFDLAAVRAEFPVTQTAIYMNHAAGGPLSRRVQHAVQQGLALLSSPGPHVFRKTFDQALSDLRERLAKLINADTDEIAFVPDTATGINYAAHGLPLQAGDNVLMCDQEFPAVVYPFMNLQRSRGIEARIVPHDGGGLTVDLLDRYADARTRAVAVSTVEFVTGFRTDLDAIGEWCRSRGAWLVVDGMQSLGAAPLDVKAAQVDVLVSGGYKWLLAPPGVGFMYVSRARLETLRPIFAGAFSVVGTENFLDYDLTFRPTAGRFELGVPNRLGLIGFLESLSYLQEVGIEHIQAWTLHLTDHLLMELDNLGYKPIVNRALKHRSAIVSFKVMGEDDPVPTAKKLAAANIVHSVRHGCIRLSPHFYNSTEEVLQVSEVLRQG